jgi:hypothetical protein
LTETETQNKVKVENQEQEPVEKQVKNLIINPS